MARKCDDVTGHRIGMLITLPGPLVEKEPTVAGVSRMLEATHIEVV